MAGNQRSLSIRPTLRMPIPKGVVEVTGISSGEASALVERKDGSFMLFGGTTYRVSTDGGATWGEKQTPNLEGTGRAQGLSCARLRSGRLALAFRDESNQFQVVFSDDEGRTWKDRSPMDLLGSPYYDVLTELESGRLIMPNRTCFSNQYHPGLEYREASSWGLWKGLPLQVSGHYHYPEIDIASVSYSDDGRTWHRCTGEIFGWFDAEGVANGTGGVTACDEPSVAETSDGRVLFFARSTVGRLVACYSSDGGEVWSAVRPTELASSYSPPRLRRIPKTGDLICIWNQVSREEIRRGYRRGRLSCAISRDSGFSWENFKTIELSAGMEDVDRIPPEYPTSPVIGLPKVGVLPDDFMTFDYANICFAGDNAFLMYGRGWVEAAPERGEARSLGEHRDPTAKSHESVLRIYPVEWFYR